MAAWARGIRFAGAQVVRGASCLMDETGGAPRTTAPSCFASWPCLNRVEVASMKIRFAPDTRKRRRLSRYSSAAGRCVGHPAHVMVVVLLVGGLPTSGGPDSAPDPTRLGTEMGRQEEPLLTYHLQQARLFETAYRITRVAVPLCPEYAARRAGMMFASAYSYDAPWRSAARASLGLGDAIKIVILAPSSAADRAGLQVGDELIRVAGRDVFLGERGIRELREWLAELEGTEKAPIAITYLRDGALDTAELTLDETCGGPALVVDSEVVDAWSDGKRIFVTSAAMRSADDTTLAVIVGHELAHNALGHIEVQGSEALLRALGGQDGGAGVIRMGFASEAGYYSVGDSRLAAAAFREDSEREADYLSLNALHLLGISPEAAERFWRRVSEGAQDDAALAFTHPTSVERLALMERTVAEIHRNEEDGLASLPEPELAVVATLEDVPEEREATPLVAVGELARRPEIGAEEESPMELDEVTAEEAEAGEPAANLLALAGGRWLGELQPGIGTSYVVEIEFYGSSRIGSIVGRALYVNPSGECSYLVRLETLSGASFGVVHELERGNCTGWNRIVFRARGTDLITGDWLHVNGERWLTATLRRQRQRSPR